MVGVDGIEGCRDEEGKEMTTGQRGPACSVHNVVVNRSRDSSI